MRRLAVSSTLVLAVTLGAGACSSSSDSSSKTTTTKKTETTAKARSFEVSTPEGQVSLSLDGQLPPNWPSGFPVPDGAKAAGSGSLGGDSSATMVAVYTTSKSGKDTFGFYTGQSSLQPSDQKSTAIGNTYAGTMKIAKPDSGSVTVTELDGTTYIIVVLETSGSTTGTTTAS